MSPSMQPWLLAFSFPWYAAQAWHAVGTQKVFAERANKQGNHWNSALGLSDLICFEDQTRQSPPECLCEPMPSTQGIIAPQITTFSSQKSPSRSQAKMTFYLDLCRLPTCGSYFFKESMSSLREEPGLPLPLMSFHGV